MNDLFKTIRYKVYMFFLPKGAKKRPSNTTTPKDAASFYDFKMKAIDGKTINFNDYKGKKVLIVNIASKCGFTPQYEELEALNQKHKDKLVILGFPSNDFLGQEPKGNSEIASFCQINFGVTFPLFEKSRVKKGEEQNVLYKWLSSKKQNGWNGIAPYWNFCKYLINEKGELIRFYSPTVKPLSNDIVGLL